jgi:hypothetical protein
VQRPAIAFSACTVDCAEYKYVGCRNMCCGFVVCVRYRYSFVNMELSFPGAQRVGRGPYSVWRQTYVGDDKEDQAGAGEALAPDVELIVRELFVSEDLDVEDVSVVVCYKRLDRGGHSVGQYTFGFVIRGYPVGIAEDEVGSWGPDVSSLDHKLVHSSILPARSKAHVWEAFSELKDIYDDDESAVQLRQYCRSLASGKLCVTVWKKDALDASFKESKSWVSSPEPRSRSSLDGGVCPAAVNERKRKADDGSLSARKNAKAKLMVSVLVNCSFIVNLFF